MKFVLLSLLMISCAHNSKKNDSYLVRADIIYNSKKVETFEILANDSQKAVATVSDQMKKYTTTLTIEPSAAKIKGVDGIKLKLGINHQSQRHGIIQNAQEVFVESGIEAEFFVEDGQNVLKTKLIAARTVQKGEDPRICMATIYEAQRDYKKNNLEFADKLELIKSKISCPRDAKITLTRFRKSAFMAIGSFKNDIWVINEKRYMVHGVK